MAFVWTEDVGVGDSIDAADVNEVKTNLDTIYTTLSITRGGCASGAGWTELPVSTGDDITSAQFQQMRDATDYAYDNKCPGYCNDENTGYNYGDDTGANTGEDGTYCSSDLGGRNLSGYNLNEKGTYNTGANSDEDGTYCSSDLGGRNLSGYNLNENGGYNLVV